MRVRGTIRYWAAAKAAAGVAEEIYSAATLAEALAAARALRDERFAAVLDRCAFVVDGAPVGPRSHASVALKEGGTVEVLPPFAGGASQANQQVTEPKSAHDRGDGVDRSGARTADEALVRALYAEHAGPLLSYALRLTGDRSRAEDVVQETLLRAWRHPEAMESDRGSLRPWLFTVAHNIAVDQHRARRSRPREVSAEQLVELPAPDELDRALQAWQVAAAVATLSDEHRGVLLETYYRGRSVAEAAAALGVPAGTVKSRTYYALRALRLALEERGVTA